MSLVERYEIKSQSRRRVQGHKVQLQKKILRKEAPESAQYFQRIIDTRLICGVRTRDKLRAFIKLCRLAQMGTGRPHSDLGDVARASTGIPPMEAAARWIVERNKILANVRDNYERAFLDFYARGTSDILNDVDKGFVPYGEAKTALNSALMDIVKADHKHRPIIEVITSVCKGVR